jgi:hypothetical protein
MLLRPETQDPVFSITNHKWLLGIISGKFTSHTMEGDKEIAKHFVAAVAIRDFMPVEFRP